MTNLHESGASKQALRRQAAARRSHASREAGPDAALRLADNLLRRGELAKARMISGYWPMREEVDPRPAMEALHARGAGLCLPVIVGAERPLVFRRWQPGDPLVTEASGTSVPGQTAPEEVPDILLVPLLAFDDEGYRLGYGGGFYDRTLEKLRGGKEPLAVGLAFAAQYVESLPSGMHDEKLDLIATEQGVRTF